MKKIPLIAVTLFAFFTANFAVADNRPEWLSAMSTSICGAYRYAESMADDIDKIVTNKIKENYAIDEPSPDQVAEFWNEHIENLTCDIDGKQIHVMHHAFDMNLAFHSLFKDYLDARIQRKLTDKSININVNFVIDGQTVLDFTDSEIRRFEQLVVEEGEEYYAAKIKRMKRVRKLLTRQFDAKHVHELENAIP